jgi:hypothetical protein
MGDARGDWAGSRPEPAATAGGGGGNLSVSRVDANLLEKVEDVGAVADECGEIHEAIVTFGHLGPVLGWGRGTDVCERRGTRCLRVWQGAGESPS